MLSSTFTLSPFQRWDSSDAHYRNLRQKLTPFGNKFRAGLSKLFRFVDTNPWAVFLKNVITSILGACLKLRTVFYCTFSQTNKNISPAPFGINIVKSPPSVTLWGIIGILWILFSSVPELYAKTYQPCTDDNHMSSSSPDSNWGTNTLLGLSYDYGLNNRSRGLIHFDISDIPDGAIFLQGDIRLYLVKTSAGGDATITLSRLVQTNWTELGATWNRYDGTNAWATAGGDYTTTNAVTISGIAATGWQTFISTALIQDCYDNQAKHIHIHIKNQESVENRWWGVYSSEYTDDTALRPKLTVIYTCPPNAPSALGQRRSDDGAPIAFNTWTNNLTPRATFYLSDDDAGDDVKYRIQVSTKSDFSVNLISHTSVELSQGTTNYIMAGLSSGASYYWRVMTIDTYTYTSEWSTANAGDIAVKIDTQPPTNVSVSAFSALSYSQLKVWVTAEDSESGFASAPYFIEMSTASDFSGSISDSGWIAGTNYTFSSLARNTKYYFRVKAKDNVGNISAYSSVVSRKTQPCVWQEKATTRTGPNAFGFEGDGVWTWKVPANGGTAITITVFA